MTTVVTYLMRVMRHACDAVVCAGRDALLIACESGHLLTVIMLGCRVHGPTTEDEVRDSACWQCRGQNLDRLLVIDMLIQRHLRSALVGQWSENVDTSLLRVFLEASSLCWNRRSCEDHCRGIARCLFCSFRGRRVCVGRSSSGCSHLAFVSLACLTI
jgi:hypothetical protein